MKLKRTTPLFIVDAIEPLFSMWRDRLGYQVVVDVPHGENLGFVLLARDDQQVMLQTRASIAEDVPAVAATGVGFLLYNDVERLSDVLAEMEGVEVLVPERTTFYGAREVFYRVGPGQVLAFAEGAEEEKS